MLDFTPENKSNWESVCLGWKIQTNDWEFFKAYHTNDNNLSK